MIYHYSMNPKLFLLLNLAFGFYSVGTIWAHEVDIFRTWKLVDAKSFHKVQDVHWHKLPFWVFIPVGLSLAGSIALIWYHPANSPLWCVFGVPFCQILSLILTGAFWGRWQSHLARDPLGSKSPYLSRILKTHWIRTVLINASGLILLVWTVVTLT
ncbi:MAG: hypothetical protein ABSG17_06460 [Spirochaetia bacterium]